METKQYPTNPLPHLELNKKTADELDAQFNLNGVHLNKPEDEAYEKSLKLYPEDQDDCYERTRLNLERQKQSVLEQNEDDSLVAEIIVSHAFFVTGVTAIFDPS